MQMPRKLADQEMEEECKKKRIAPNGFRLPDPIRDGEVLTDVKDKKWRIGKSVGLGGFGEIYLASDEIHKPVSEEAEFVVKVEPHSNGPLFVEMNFYIRAAQEEMVSSWVKKRKLKFLGMPYYVASGSHEYKGEKYRFLVMKRFGKDLGKVFLESKKRFHLQTVLHLGVQILNILEYVHAQDYIHADIKASNILLSKPHSDDSGRVYLVDFGLACRYRKQNGKHKEYHHDERRAHDGTPEYTSRDAHIGAHSRRGDLEILGYNMLQWLCSELPWESSLSDMEYVHMQKKSFMSNIPSLMRRCFPSTGHPEVIEKYLRYVASLGFETQPDYAYCRSLFKHGARNEMFENSGKILFGLKAANINTKGRRGTKRKAADEPENQGGIKRCEVFRNAGRRPCVPQNYNRMTRNSNPVPLLRSRQNFSWEKVLSGDPEVLLKKKSGCLGRKNHNIGFKIPHQDKQNFQEDPGIADESRDGFSDCTDDSLSNPTPAMVEVMERRKARANSVALLGQAAKKWRFDSLSVDPSDIPTPAMEEVIRKRRTAHSDFGDSAIEEQDDEDEDSDGDNGNRCAYSLRNKRPETAVTYNTLQMQLRQKRPVNMCEWSSTSSSCSNTNISSCSVVSYSHLTSDYLSVSSASCSSASSVHYDTCVRGGVSSSVKVARKVMKKRSRIRRQRKVTQSKIAETGKSVCNPKRYDLRQAN
ncbi:serine/threonine-protein kinase VRK1-like isoform X2 [Ischnura elegans]|uniref:serine/threonine-protein kinase VRK1-like isoform X2 n=1 Tax=Ischnura elegans TaxID=197161 RepID=UPI001ED88AC5|nr:serine/threonine-protein kinase VRK1-like isoform X2 [Ischnura elegans]